MSVEHGRCANASPAHDAADACSSVNTRQIAVAMLVDRSKRMVKRMRYGKGKRDVFQ
jgi:hypothetical protein